MEKKYKVGYTSGVYDMFHIGHLNIIRRAKEYCEYLIVGVTTDKLSLNRKGKLPIINENERKVFEDILINTLSTKISARISRAKNWVKEIDKLMDNVNTSNGLKLNITWVPKKGQSEDDIDTKIENLEQYGYLAYPVLNEIYNAIENDTEIKYSGCEISEELSIKEVKALQKYVEDIDLSDKEKEAVSEYVDSIVK
jgi:glycerol-3-phosphate cytidylyltransferase